MDMTTIISCNESSCAYNKENGCHTLGITVGPHAECNTYIHASSRGGFPEVRGGIGACIALNCKFNKRLECNAPSINVVIHDKHADCETFQAKK